MPRSLERNDAPVAGGGLVAARLLDGATAAAAVRAQVAAGAADLQARTGVQPTLVCVMGGVDAASRTYVRSIVRAAERAGVQCRQIGLEQEADDVGLRAVLQALNADASVHGVIMQFPLPAPLSQLTVSETLDPRKDVDGITPVSAGRLALGQPTFVPSTPLGGVELVKHYGISLSGLEATVVGRSAVVGKPLALHLLNEHATVTVCHTRTRDRAAACRRADLLCAATGRPELITKDMIKPGAIVLDFGTTPGPDGALIGDVDFAAASDVASWISPVPGGTGPMTTAMLLRNTLAAARSIVLGEPIT